MPVIFQMSNKQCISFLTKRSSSLKCWQFVIIRIFHLRHLMNLLGLKTCFLLGHSFSFFLPSFLCKFYIYFKQSCEGICCLYFNFHCLARYTVFLKTETWEVSLRWYIVELFYSRILGGIPTRELLPETNFAFIVSLSSK